MRVFTVTEYREELNQLLGQVTVAIQGEVTGFNISQNRFVWFSLADDQTVVQCFMMAFQLRVPLEDGMEVRVVGSPSMFKKGQVVFQPRQIDLVGDGSLRRAYEQLKTRLTTEGLFDESRKRTLPRFPTRIGLVTSADAAAYTDVLRILRNRWPALTIVHMPVSVQGRQAERSIVAGLRQLNEDEPDLDCIILTRGGGSMEDLHAFNSEDVVRAVFASRIPVVSGVGHERDVTLTDLVADVRASTPSNAAERVVPDVRDVRSECAHLVTRMEHGVTGRLQTYRTSIQDAIGVLEHHARFQNQRFVDAHHRLQLHFRGFAERVVLWQDSVRRSLQLLHSYHPERVLQRGYSMTVDESGRLITNVQQLKVGQSVTTTLASGAIDSTITHKRPIKK